MASITTEPKGRKTIQFKGKDGKRRSIRLGKVSLRLAESVKVRVEQLNAAAITGHAMDAETARWLPTIEGELADKLASVGLIPLREVTTLDSFIQQYCDSRSNVKPALYGCASSFAMVWAKHHTEAGVALKPP